MHQTSMLSDDAVNLFRAVSPEEIDDIFQIGGFRAIGNSLQGKQFGLNLQEILRLSDFLPNSSAIIQVRIPKGTLQEMDLTPVDPSILRSGPVTAQPGRQLTLLNESIIDLKQVL